MYIHVYTYKYILLTRTATPDRIEANGSAERPALLPIPIILQLVSA